MSERIHRSSTANGNLEKKPRGRVPQFMGTYFGFIKENKDAHKNGRFKVWIPYFSSRPEDEAGIFTAIWLSPFIGSTPVYDNTTDVELMETSQTSYGMWMQPPDLDNQVLVSFVNGDPQNCIIIGCMPQAYMNHMLPGNAAKPPNLHHEGDVDPFDLPVVEYNKNIEEDFSDSTTKRPVNHWHALGLRNQGLVFDKIRGLTTASGRRDAPSEAYGIITPGPIDDRGSSKKRKQFTSNERESGYPTARKSGHQFVMDDNKEHEYIRLRTRSGAQLLLDETNGTVRLNNRDGTGWVEMDEKGRINVYGTESISMRSERDFMVRADRDILFEAGRDISIKANKDWNESFSGTQHAGEFEGEGGNITIHANEDLSIISANDWKVVIDNDTTFAFGNNFCTIVSNEMSTQVEKGVDFIVNDGPYDLSIDGDYNHNASGTSSIFSGFDNKIQAINDTEIFTYTGKMDIGSQLQMTVKSYEGDITIEALTENMKLMSNEGANQITMRNPYLNIFSTGEVVNQSKREISNQVNEDFDVNNDKEPTKGGVPLSGGCFRFPDGVNVSFKPLEIDMQAVEDVYFKVENGISDVTGKADTAISGINKGLEMLEEGVNDLSATVWDTFNQILGINAFPINFTLPTLPTFPTPPSIQLPSINLPDINFDFCIELGSFLNIDSFNIIPNNLFGTINIDLGGWTKRNFTDWFDRNKAGFENMVNSFDIASQITNAFDLSMQEIDTAINSIRFSLDNLVNISITDNGLQYANYAIGLNDLSNGLNNFISNEPSHPSVPSLKPLRNEVEAQRRTAQELSEKALSDPSFDSTDFSEFSEASNFFEELSISIGPYV